MKTYEELRGIKKSIAILTDEQIKKLKEYEREMNVILIAHEKQKG